MRKAAGWEMPTFASFHQVPYIRNSPDNDFAQRRYAVGPPGAPRELELIDAPTISHWRDIYFRPEGSGLIFGTHHRLLQPDDYEPTGGEIAGTRVRDLGLPREALITLIVRGTQAVPPRGSTRIAAGDALHMMVRAEAADQIPDLLERWRDAPGETGRAPGEAGTLATE